MNNGNNDLHVYFDPEGNEIFYYGSREAPPTKSEFSLCLFISYLHVSSVYGLGNQPLNASPLNHSSVHAHITYHASWVAVG